MAKTNPIPLRLEEAQIERVDAMLEHLKERKEFYRVSDGSPRALLPHRRYIYMGKRPDVLREAIERGMTSMEAELGMTSSAPGVDSGRGYLLPCVLLPFRQIVTADTFIEIRPEQTIELILDNLRFPLFLFENLFFDPPEPELDSPLITALKLGGIPDLLPYDGEHSLAAWSRLSVPTTTGIVDQLQSAPPRLRFPGKSPLVRYPNTLHATVRSTSAVVLRFRLYAVVSHPGFEVPA